MTLTNDQTEQFIQEYKIYINKIINHTYYRAEPETKDELRQVGLIGLWKGIKAYYNRDPEVFNQKEFVDTICAYIRYAMADLFGKQNVIKISGNQWRNYVEADRIITANPNTPEENLKILLKDVGLKYDWYLQVKNMLSMSSLDAAVDDESDTNKYNFILCSDCDMKRLMDQAYADYIIDSAFAGIELDRDKDLIQTWVDSIYDGFELEQTQLAQLYGLSSGMVGVILSRFIDVCRFVRACDSAFDNNPNGSIDFPEIKENRMADRKIPGVKWVLRNRKWKVEITVGKSNSIFIGYFENYEDAVRARRDAEIKYRGKSDIEV